MHCALHAGVGNVPSCPLELNGGWLYGDGRRVFHEIVLERFTVDGPALVWLWLRV